MENTAFIHHTAEVSERAELSPGVKIWNLVQVREDSVIGADTIISKNVYIDFAVTIGARVKIQNNVSVYNGVTIEDEVFVGPCVVFTNDFRPRAVADDWQVTPTLIEKGASLGANCTIVCGTVIGGYAMVAAGSVVTKSVAPHVLVAGNPAKPIAYVYKDGNKVMPEHIQGVEGEQVLYRNPLNQQVLAISKDNLKICPK
ncbi:MAG: UDP-2-acetamido-3-amino-2,3-dideoxy-glucuronate N-acetyltransferase [Phenylobacterium sp.]|jgi:UDP-2-acetamido-3-amino-2,3-dideoxy-glucuronate N-acetyltransferase